MRIFLNILVLLTLVACNNTSNKQSVATNQFYTLKKSYASGFRIIKGNSHTIVEIFNPWQQAHGISIKYNLVNKTVLNNYTSQGTFIHVPVKKAICMSTSYIAFLDMLGETNSIIGVSGSKYVNNPLLEKKIAAKEIYDVGYEQSLNYEMLIKLKPDVLFAYGVGGEISGYINKLKELGIPVVLVGEYLETDPLAKAEWLKFFAEFYCKQNVAQNKFDTIADQYLKLKKVANAARYNPSVIVDLPWNGSWHIAGGRSYIAKMIDDAGGNYLWKNDNSHETVPIDLEIVFHQALNSDFWINIGNVNNKREILAVDSRFENLRPFKTGKLYNNNARQNINGGNDYWESGAVNPQIILKDLIVILHPELLPGQKLYYYKKIY
jgi:iron complex transport system substrate-binding protein